MEPFLFKLIIMEEKECKKCGNILPLDCFHLDKSKKDGRKNICKQCLSKKKVNKSSKVDRNIRQCIIYCLKHDGPFKWEKILGYSKQQLKDYLESQFEEGMTFSNYGEWGITFHIPKRCYNFNSFINNDFKKCWSLKNLKPMWKNDILKRKVEISKKELDKYSLWDILPEGNISAFLID